VVAFKTTVVNPDIQAALKAEILKFLEMILTSFHLPYDLPQLVKTVQKCRQPDRWKLFSV
jgi:hypothetical protein